VTAAGAAPVLAVDDVSVSFGSLWALRGVSLKVEPGRTVGLIGPNGAGKSTLLNVIAGATLAKHGSVLYRGGDITHVSTPTRARAGLRRTFQHLELFEEMTVLENVQVAAETVGGDAGRPGSQEIAELLDGLGIGGYAHVEVHRLPHPVKRLISYARAVVGRPVCLLLDEPVAGLAESERHAFAERMRDDIRRRGLTVVLIEHDMRFIEGLCDEVYVLNAGEIIAHGSFAEISRSAAVRAAYLGEPIDG
jgi:ABC-type branched-subunit amino acid transport system ATPase component